MNRPSSSEQRAGQESEQQAKLAALSEAIASYQAGDNPIIDEGKEEALAPIKRKATRLINHRPRSEHELRTRLLEDDHAPELVDAVVARCVDNGMIDDGVFAAEWVRQRSMNQKKSVSVLRRELLAKGVAARHIETALAEVDDDDQHQIMVELIHKKAHTIKRAPKDRQEYLKFLRRITGVAARRGFPEGAAVREAREALDNRISELG